MVFNSSLDLNVQIYISLHIEIDIEISNQDWYGAMCECAVSGSSYPCTKGETW